MGVRGHLLPCAHAVAAFRLYTFDFIVIRFGLRATSREDLVCGTMEPMFIDFWLL